jgi:hypothetical protein
MGGDEQRGYYVKVKPGRYTMLESGLASKEDTAAATVIDVPPGAVFLYPMKFTRVRQGASRDRRLVPLSPEDQKAAAALLVDWLDYEKWFGRLVVGFGPYPPRLVADEGNVEFDITSVPAGAQVTVDDQPWGTTPAKTTLHTGKHLVQLEIPGVALTKTFVDVQSKGEVNITIPILPPTEAKAAREKADRITILLSGFQNMGSADNDNLRSVFPQVIGGDLGGDQRIVLVDAGELVARGQGIPGKPDFALANQKGIDLIVTGYYTARQDGLMVYAALYDVKSELPRTSIMYTGNAGLAMFDSIDAMAAQFIQGIDKVLPDVRTSSVKEGAAVESRVVSYEKKRSENTIIAKRQALRSSLTFFDGPSVAATNGAYQPDGINGVLTFLPLGAIYTYSLGGPISVMALFQPSIQFGHVSQKNVDYGLSSPYLDIPFRFGPEYTLFGYNVDLSFAMTGGARFNQIWQDSGSGGTVVYKPTWYFSLALETSARLYLQSKVSQRPSFFFLGFEWFIIGMQTAGDFSSPKVSPLELSLALGYGFRL